MTQRILSIDSSEWGYAIGCSPGTPLEGKVTDLLLFNFEMHKEKNFPLWTGTPDLINGGLHTWQELKRDDGLPVDPYVLDRFHEYDEDTQARLHPEIPEGHHTEPRSQQRYAWYAIVPNEFRVSACACGGECDCGKSSESQGE